MRHYLAQGPMNMELKFGKLFSNLGTLCRSIMTISDISMRHYFNHVALVLQIVYEQLKSAISSKFINSGCYNPSLKHATFTHTQDVLFYYTRFYGKYRYRRC